MKPGVTDEAFVITELIRPSPYIASYLTTFTLLIPVALKRFFQLEGWNGGISAARSKCLP